MQCGAPQPEDMTKQHTRAAPASCAFHPCLQFKAEVLAAMFQAADEEEQAAKLYGAGGAAPQEQRLAWGWLARLLSRGAEAAPGPTEANLSEEMRRAAAQPKGATAEVMGRYMPEVLQASGRLVGSQSFLMPAPAA